MTYKRIMYKKRSACQGVSRQIERTCPIIPAPSETDCERYVGINDAPSLAAVYGISQSWRGIDDGCEGFERGTIFNELDKPFMGDKCKNGGCCK